MKNNNLLTKIKENNFLIIGRAGIDIYPDPPGTKTENATHFVTHLGGSSANIAVALSATATALATARTIGGTSFNGTANIDVALAAVATAVTVADESSDTTCFPLFTTGATGELPPKSGSNLTFNSSSGTLTVVNLAASGTVDGRDVAADGTKLDGIESSATADQTAAQILTALRTVDVNGTSGVNAGTLDGQAASHYRINVYNAAGNLLN